MPAKNTTKVLIGGKIITLSGYESEEYLQRVASYMNHKIAQLSELPGYSRQPMETKNNLLSLNIADDYFKARHQAEVFEEDSQRKDKEMYDLKHDLIEAQIQLENLKKENEQLKQDKEALAKQNRQLEEDMDSLLNK
ncbi:MAG TPA: cell division protein ZapA [Candidatus Pullilachnospira intestinigallinarum]|uniref:Cell division protein ZapA n=1 Tax=Candidatus Pullilachnospira stercoravium TaxID=2840913 RepID=A0A9D1T570_9FIRM|nr:cell division protein ZapA [Clostridiales bacterium]HIS25646.1 cell division protein ZapA [Candidatus Pullilachnospira intestinigallinarum]HIV11891.1 cell division protein ZapA [Candidatus Pullilachnospira stercoravium]